MMEAGIGTLLKEECRKRKMIFWLLSLAVFLVLPLPVFFDLLRWGGATSDIEYWLGLVNLRLSLILSGSAVILALSAFRCLYPHKRAALDETCGLSNHSRFLLFYMTGIVMLLSIYGVNLALALCSLMVMKTHDAEALTLLYSTVCHLIFSLLIYTAATAAMGISGTRSGCVWMILVFLFLPLIGCVTWYMYFYWSFVTFVTSEDVLIKILSITSPVSAYLMHGFSEELPEPGKLAGYALAWAGWAGIAWKLFQRRSTKDSGKPVIYRRFGAAVQVFAVIICPLWAAWISRFFSPPIPQGGGYRIAEENFLMTLLAFAAGAVAVHVITELVDSGMNIHRIFSHKCRFFLCLILSLGIFFSFRLDLWGYDRFYPEKEKVAFAALEIPVLDGWVRSDQGSYALEQMKLTDPEIIYPLIDLGREQIPVGKGWRLEGDNIWQSSPANTVNVRYHMKNGRNILRGYYVDRTSLMAECEKLFQNPEYKKGAFPVLSLSSDKIPEIALEYLGQEIPVLLDEEERSLLLSCYQMDFEDLTFGTIQEESPNAVLSFQEGCWNPLYSTFQRTRRFLEERGLPDGQLESDKVERIELSQWSHMGCVWYGGEVLPIQDKEQIETALQCSAFFDYSYMNCWNTRLWKGITVTVFARDGTQYDFEMDLDRVPEFVNFADE